MARATPATCCSGHVAAIADVLAAAGLVGTDVAGANDLAVFLSNEGFSVVSQPISQSISFGHIAIQSVGLAGTYCRADDAPDRRGIVHLSRADAHGCHHFTQAECQQRTGGGHCSFLLFRVIGSCTTGRPSGDLAENDVKETTPPLALSPI